MRERELTCVLKYLNTQRAFVEELQQELEQSKKLLEMTKVGSN